jgi:hypothetical protein
MSTNSPPGWPGEMPTILKVYFSPAQIAAPSPPNQIRLSREPNSWWYDKSGSSSPDPLSYADAIRIRSPGIPFRGLGLHVDAGSLCRWTDPVYQSLYLAIFSGNLIERMRNKQ